MLLSIVLLTFAPLISCNILSRIELFGSQKRLAASVAISKKWVQEQCDYSRACVDSLFIRDQSVPTNKWSQPIPETLQLLDELEEFISLPKTLQSPMKCYFALSYMRGLTTELPSSPKSLLFYAFLLKTGNVMGARDITSSIRVLSSPRDVLTYLGRLPLPWTDYEAVGFTENAMILPALINDTHDFGHICNCIKPLNISSLRLIKFVNSYSPIRYASQLSLFDDVMIPLDQIVASNDGITMRLIFNFILASIRLSGFIRVYASKLPEPNLQTFDRAVINCVEELNEGYLHHDIHLVKSALSKYLIMKSDQ